MTIFFRVSTRQYKVPNDFVRFHTATKTQCSISINLGLNVQWCFAILMMSVRKCIKPTHGYDLGSDVTNSHAKRKSRTIERFAYKNHRLTEEIVPVHYTECCGRQCCTCCWRWLWCFLIQREFHHLRANQWRLFIIRTRVSLWLKILRRRSVWRS